MPTAALGRQQQADENLPDPFYLYIKFNKMRNITWNFGFEKGTDHSNYKATSIYSAFARLERYWKVSFTQVSKNPQMQIILSNQRKGSGVAMWQNGKRIFVQAHFNWPNNDFMAAALVHEIGHWLVNGGGHGKTGVMAAVLMYSHVNFSQEDMKWFGSLQFKSDLRPWHEENIWKITTPIKSLYSGGDLINIKCCTKNSFSLLDYFFTPRVKIQNVLLDK